MTLPKRKAALAAETQRKRLQTAFGDASADDEAFDPAVYPSSAASSSSFEDMDELMGNTHSEDLTPVTSTTPPATPSFKSLAKARTRAEYPSNRKIHHCPFEHCEKAFNRPARLQEHLRSHNNERIFNCPHEDCDKSFIRASHLNHHVKSAHTTIRDYVCSRPGCGKSFVTGTRLRRHMTAHEGRDKFRCTGYEGCDETFRKHSTLQRHIMSVHQGLKPFPCEHCDAGFETAGHLRAHVARLHGEPRFTCTECRVAPQDAANDGDASAEISMVSFPTYALLQSHIRTVHPPSCSTCGHVCTNARELRTHMDVQHGISSHDGADDIIRAKPAFRCPLETCGREFNKKGNLNVHIRTVHQGEKRFVCGETDLSNSKKVEGYDRTLHGCNKRYGSKLALEEHIRTAHLGLKNVKAERKQKSMDFSNQTADSGADLNDDPTLHAVTGEYGSEIAALTGADAAASGKADGRHIPCLLSSCLYKFMRDYDLWVHMNAHHALSEGIIQWLLMRRTMSGTHETFDLSAEGFFDEDTHFFGSNGLNGLEGATLSLNLFDDCQAAPSSFEPTGTNEPYL